ncbi:MAG: hypothetical protein LBJ08_00325, partial [Bifidobacteriaceae bacterium]|nr:hypothetical protein [Bifidobacteriaceae bacterium]
MGVPPRGNATVTSWEPGGDGDAELVQDGDVIVLDDSSTVAAMVEHLVLRRDLTVLTHSLAAMRTVADLV